MVNVLIPTKPDDAHAIYVKLALEKKGHQATLWYTADFPQQQTHSFELTANGISWSATGVDFHVDAHSYFDVVWFRRPRKPVLSPQLHPDDYENANNENLSLYQTFWQVIAPDAFWVNPFHTAKPANCKLQQLKVAKEVGFSIPKTLISNDPLKIKHFISANLATGTIYKTLYPVAWTDKNEMRLTYTKEIRISDLPSNAMLQNTPGIFQEKISKAFELRVTCFGEQAVAAKLCSQLHPKGIMDWRYVPTHELIIEEFDLPEHIHLQCKLLMKKMGLAFGCFDFIVTPDEEYYFLEINEQGQFLWIEEVNPTIKMLDKFVCFLSKSSHVAAKKGARGILSLLDFRTDMVAFQEKAMQIHQKPVTFF